MNRLGQDIKFALRQLRKSLGFTLAVVLTLSLGIGLNAAIFTIVDCVLLRPLGYRDADRIVALKTQFTNQGRSIPRLGGGDYVDLERQVKSLKDVAYYGGPFKDGALLGDHAVYTDITGASSHFFDVMGVQPAAGRLFSPAGDQHDVVVSSGFAREHFGTVENAVGKQIRYEDKLSVIAGVVPDGFSFPGKTSVWVELTNQPDVLNRTAYNQRAIGKLREQSTPGQLAAELRTLSAQLSRQYVEDKDKALIAVSLQEQIVGNIRPLLRLLMGSVLVVLLIVCANITHLQLVRSAQQKREIAIRTALGSTRSHVAWRALLEAVILSAFGCAAATAIAEVALRLIVRRAPEDIPRLGDVHLNWHVVLFSFVLSFTAMALTALLPVWKSWRIDPVKALKQDAEHVTESGASSRLRDALVIAEVSLTLVLSVSAVLLTRHLIAEGRAELGFDADNVLLVEVHAPRSAGPPSQQRVDRLNNTLEAVRATPAVQSAAAVSGAPTGSMLVDVGYAIRGRMEFAPGVKLPNANIVPVTPGYFQTMRIPLLRGRSVEQSDVESNEYVAVISSSMAAAGFAGEDPIGQEIMCGYDRTMRWMRIVGVVGDVRQDSPASAPSPTFYVPVAQHPRAAADVQLVIRTSMAPAAMLRTVISRLEQVDPTLAIGATTMRASIGESQRADSFRTLLFSAFAVLSVLLAAIGMYSVTAYAVAQRRFEFALRFALGASRGGVLNMVLARSFRVATIGVLTGAVLSTIAMRYMNALLGRIGDFNASTYGLAMMGVMLIALLAAYVPARRASAIEPMEALRTR